MTFQPGDEAICTNHGPSCDCGFVRGLVGNPPAVGGSFIVTRTYLYPLSCGCIMVGLELSAHRGWLWPDRWFRPFEQDEEPEATVTGIEVPGFKRVKVDA